ncbi:Mfa1 family fimbria major subunit [Bacteroides caecigallinarum]|uniref:Mfa1 family fimbria major subunit n=1 Tax=Bacteroides caecigallinarum TaxID=1411144 RepID=UPI00195C3DF3|nr:Mfa1 family fimbria major subunit [Bacteroides caecigallinarum]MBM6890433.1 Mfa1 family fimbria major subunit [Bacteroides caecigallinarum]
MKKGIGMKYVGCVLIGAMAILCSCRDELRPDLSPAQEGKTNIIVNLTVERSGSKSPASRSPLDPNGDEYTLGFTDAENQINSLTLIMMRIDASGNEVFEASKTIQSPDTDKDGDYYVEFQLETNDRGVKHFYLGANLSENHLASFRTQDKVFDAGEEDSGHNIVGALMNVKHSQELDGNIGEGSNIVMTAPILVGDKQDITIPSGSTEETITIDNPVKLTRTVAKVLLTCVPKSDAEEYVKVIDAKDAKTNPEGDGENTGWIKFADVNYMLNVLNRKTYLNYRIKDDNLIDPNYAMGELISQREEGGGYGITNLDEYQREFLYYDTQAMVEMLNKDVQDLEGKTPEACTSRIAIKYDTTKIGKVADKDHYTEGLYCTENTVYNDMTFANEADFQSAIRYVTTRVMVGAKYTPKQIWNGEDAPVQASTEAEAQGILDKVEDVDNPLEPVTYLAGTFWRDSKGNYYSLKGMKKKLEKSPGTEFSRYDGGWGYYYTYIDGDANGEGTIDYANQTRWGIKRNHYYILKVDKIIAPGSPFPGNETMRIHSELVDWVDKGSSEVEIKVPQQSETAQP